MEQVQLPAELLNLIVLGVTAAVTWLVVEGFKGLGGAFGKDFSVAAKLFAVVISAGAVSIVTGVISVALSFVPAEYAQVAQGFLGFLVLLFSAFGVQRQAKLAREPRG